MHQTKNDLTAHKHNQAISLLEPLLNDAIDLRLQAKQAHWNVKGESFISLHELFDQVSTQVDGAVDLLAERIVQLGGEATGSIRTIAKHSRLKDYPYTAADGQKHVEALSSAIAAFIKPARAGIDASTDFGDAVTADILTELVRGLDKLLWFVESHRAK